jgi:hypothetical protein
VNIYKNILNQNIDKILSLYNMDTNSQTFGFGDREYWGWKTKDFSNGSLQGGVHSLSIALKLGIFENNEELILELINASILAIRKIRNSNGSMVEAYPRENSFCVTALVAFDSLSAIKHLGNRLSISRKEEYLKVIEPLINFIKFNGEEHAIISNHLATGVAAMSLWYDLTNTECGRAEELFKIIIHNQSDEGWYKEYEGADPGYQTLCTYYLFCAYSITRNPEILVSIKKSAEFLKHFIHPDNTIGGLYGSRNTEVYYPGGIIGFSNDIEDLALIAQHLTPNKQHVLPQNIDIGNFIPLLNSYAVAALHYEENNNAIKAVTQVPFFTNEGIINFKETGIYLHSNKKYFVVVNYKKGGTIKLFDKSTQFIDFEDGGLFGDLKNGVKFSTQQFDDTINFDDQCIESDFYKINESSPNPFNFIILRSLGLTIFRSVRLGNLFKKFIVNMLMTGKNKVSGNAIRRFDFKDEKVVITEVIQSPANCKSLGHIGKSKAIHMASSGYFLSQNYHNKRSNLVEFIDV